MGKRGASAAAAASGADGGNQVHEAEAAALQIRLQDWRLCHSPRTFVEAPPDDVKKELGVWPQIAGGMYTHLKKPASGDLAEWAIHSEVVCVPFVQKIRQAEEIEILGQHDELFVYKDQFQERACVRVRACVCACVCL